MVNLLRLKLVWGTGISTVALIEDACRISGYLFLHEYSTFLKSYKLTLFIIFINVILFSLVCF
jgi:hypothetical protein